MKSTIKTQICQTTRQRDSPKFDERPNGESRSSPPKAGPVAHDWAMSYGLGCGPWSSSAPVPGTVPGSPSYTSSDDGVQSDFGVSWEGVPEGVTGPHYTPPAIELLYTCEVLDLSANARFVMCWK